MIRKHSLPKPNLPKSPLKHLPYIPAHNSHICGPLTLSPAYHSPGTHRKMFLRTHHQNLSRRNQLYRCHFTAKSSENTEQIRFVFGGEGLGEYVGEDFATGFFEEG